MHVETVHNLLPMQVGVAPVAATLQRGITQFQYHDPPRGGMRFLGYGSPFADTRYGPSGRILKPKDASGALVDIYV
ncbi:MAG: hypothetical protein ACOWYE_16480 [Desulfatiglandales bacterium]